MTLRLPVSAFHQLYLFLKKHAERRSLSEYRIRFEEGFKVACYPCVFQQAEFPQLKDFN